VEFSILVTFWELATAQSATIRFNHHLTAVNSIIYGNDDNDTNYDNPSYYTVSYSCTDLSGIGNIDQDPLFYLDGKDWSLKPTSPCINTGSDAYVNTGDTDIQGASRIAPYKKEFTGIDAAVDMGCYEWPDSHAFGLTAWMGFNFAARKYPGFPDDIPVPRHFIPELNQFYVDLLDEMGVKTLRMWFPWSFFEPLQDEWLWDYADKDFPVNDTFTATSDIVFMDPSCGRASDGYKDDVGHADRCRGALVVYAGADLIAAGDARGMYPRRPPERSRTGPTHPNRRTRFDTAAPGGVRKPPEAG